MLVRTLQQLLQHPLDRLRILAVEIRRAHAQAEQATRRSLEAMISAGEKLFEAKSLLDPGQCGPWLKEHCRMDLARNRSILDQAIQNDSARVRWAAHVEAVVNSARSNVLPFAAREV
jgi:hypothetical protein